MALIKGTLSLLVACSLLNGIFAISMLLIYHVVTYFVYKIKFFNHIKFHERSYFYMEQKQTSDPLVQYFSIYVYFKIVYSQKEKNIFLYWFCWLALFLESKQFHNNKIHIYDKYTRWYKYCIISLPVPHFEHRSLPAISSPLISYASGLAASRRHQGVLYTHNDRASPHPYVFALNASTSALIATLRIFPATNENWEDIAVGPCGNKSCIYILESGNVVHGHQAQKIYRVEEPEFLYSDQILTDASELSFR